MQWLVIDKATEVCVGIHNYATPPTVDTRRFRLLDNSASPIAGIAEEWKVDITNTPTKRSDIPPRPLTRTQRTTEVANLRTAIQQVLADPAVPQSVKSALVPLDKLADTLGGT